MTSPAIVLLAEDNTIIRDGIKILLEQENDFTVVGDAPNGRDALLAYLCTEYQVSIKPVTGKTTRQKRS